MRPIFFALLIAIPSLAKEITVTDAAAFTGAAKSVVAGDTIILRDGAWADARLKIRAEGTAEKPVTIRAQTAGKVTLTGDSRLSMAGSNIVADGLWFQNPTGEESIELRIDSDEIANDCRITNCAVTFDLPAPPATASTRFVSIYGSRHRVDHCYFAGKRTPGATMVVWISPGAETKQRIDHNHFGPRQALGKNGGETIRIGDSDSSLLTAACIVEHNLFEHCNGEAECISNKSCGNIYRRNTFRAVSGTLTLRHGNGCRVENNVFLGDGAKGTGGVRIIGDDHIVTANYFENLTGDSERSALCFMLGIPNSVPNGYFQVRRARVTGNTFVNCEHNILIGLSGHKNASLPPVESEISGNAIQTSKGEAFEINCATDGITIKDNQTGREALRLAEPAVPEPAGPAWRK